MKSRDLQLGDRVMAAIGAKAVPMRVTALSHTDNEVILVDDVGASTGWVSADDVLSKVPVAREPVEAVEEA